MEEEIITRLTKLETRQETILNNLSEVKKELHDHIKSDHEVQEKILINLAQNNTKLKLWAGVLTLGIPFVIKLLDLIIK